MKSKYCFLAFAVATASLSANVNAEEQGDEFKPIRLICKYDQPKQDQWNKDVLMKIEEKRILYAEAADGRATNMEPYAISDIQELKGKNPRTGDAMYRYYAFGSSVNEYMSLYQSPRTLRWHITLAKMGNGQSGEVLLSAMDADLRCDVRY